MTQSKSRAAFLACLVFLVGVGVPLRGHDQSTSPAPGLARATVLIIRHAEEPDSGDGLSAAGETHAANYVGYFENYPVSGAKPMRPTALFAAANSGSSHRPVLTLTPLSQATGVPIDSKFKNDDYARLADALQGSDHGRYIVVCWHHGNIPNLIRALGGDPHELLPEGTWPSNKYGWVVQLRYDQQGLLKSSRLVIEKL